MNQAPTGPSSVKSDKVRALRRLANRPLRDQVGRFLVEGPQAVRELLTHRRQNLVELYLSEEAAPPAAEVGRVAADAGVKVVRVPDEVLLAMAETVNPAGVVAVATMLDRAVAELLIGDGQLVLLHEVRDPGNAGTIMRTADAAGAGGVLFSDSGVDPYNGKLVRSTAGSLFHVPMSRGVDTLSVVGQAQEAGWLVLATDLDGQSLAEPGLRELISARNVLWVFGNEAAGLPVDVSESADHRVKLPIAGQAESLNLASAAAVCLYLSVL